MFSFAVLWYFGQLAIEALPLPIDLVNEHRLYLASLAIIVPLVAIAIDRAKRIRIAIGWITLIAAILLLFHLAEEPRMDQRDKFMERHHFQSAGLCLVVV